MISWLCNYFLSNSETNPQTANRHLRSELSCLTKIWEIHFDFWKYPNQDSWMFFFWGQELAINQLVLRFGVILCKISIRWCHPMTFVLNLQGRCYKFSYRWHYRLQHPSDWTDWLLFLERVISLLRVQLEICVHWWWVKLSQYYAKIQIEIYHKNLASLMVFIIKK